MQNLLENLQDYFGDNLIWVAVASAIILLFIIFEISDRISSARQAKAGEAEAEKISPDTQEEAPLRRICEDVCAPSHEECPVTESCCDSGNDWADGNSSEDKADCREGFVEDCKADCCDEEEVADADICSEAEAEKNHDNYDNHDYKQTLKSEASKAVQQLQININIERGIVKIEKAGADISCCITDSTNFECGEADIKEADREKAGSNGFECESANTKTGQGEACCKADKACVPSVSAAEENETADDGNTKIYEPEAGAGSIGGARNSVSDNARNSAAGNVKPESASDSPKEQIVLEKLEILRPAPPKKFGPDNINTGRSGRVFTEEELNRLIKE